MNRPYRIVVLLVPVVLGVQLSYAGEPRPVRVGVFEFHPLVHAVTPQDQALAAEEHDRPACLFALLLDHIAVEEDWALEYVPGDLAEGLARLEDGRIDLLAAVPCPGLEAQKLDVTQETVISTWAQVFVRPGVAVTSALDLAGLSVGLVRNDPVYPGLRSLIGQFGIDCSVVEFRRPDEVMEALDRRWIDAGIVDRFYGARHAGRHKVEGTPVVFSPVELKVAAAKGRHPGLLATIDYHLNALKRDPNSRYYGVVEQILGQHPMNPYARYLVWGLSATTALLLIAGGLALFLRNAVRAKTSALVTANQQLEREMARRREAEQSLRQAAKMEAIGTMAGGIAHDFNNILTPIIGYVELAQLAQDRAEANRLLDGVTQGANRARELVAQILAFSRRTEQAPRPLHLQPIIKEVLKLLRASIAPNIDIGFSANGEADVVVADPTQIHQVVMNLCANAAYAMREAGGSLQVEIGTHRGPVPGATEVVEPTAVPWVRLSVRDTGTGIEPGVLERMFDPFFTTKPTGQGTGMGLAVVHGIVKTCGGTIGVESQVGRGSSFHVYLPGALAGTSDAPAAPAAQSAGRGERVLFVDDDAAIVAMAREGLSALGYQVFAFTHSSKALSVFRTNPDRFDVVVADQSMPGTSGLELAGQLMAARPGLPVLLCSGFGEEGLQEKARAVGIRECVGKPVGPRRLATAIRRALDHGPRTTAGMDDPVACGAGSADHAVSRS